LNLDVVRLHAQHQLVLVDRNDVPIIPPEVTTSAPFADRPHRLLLLALLLHGHEQQEIEDSEDQEDGEESASEPDGPEGVADVCK